MTTRLLSSHGWTTGIVLLFAVMLVSPAAEAHLNDLAFPIRPTTGAEALATMHGREIAVVEALTCRDEHRFITSLLDEGVRFGSWPTDTLFAKAAYISDRSFFSGEGSSCVTVEEPIDHWASLIRQVVGGDRVNPSHETLNRAYVALFGPSCEAVFDRLSDTTVRGILTPECLIAQIGTVLRQPRLGQWEWDKKTNALLYKNPGTDGLPCLSSFRGGNHDGTKGDWDMSVVSYTRLSYFLHEALDKNWQLSLVSLGGDFPVPPGTAGFTPPSQLPAGFTFQDAMRKLDQYLLTLRGLPNDGTYNLVLTCGNPDNNYGSATDYIDGNDVYDEAEGQEPSSTGEDFAKWLLALALLLLLLAAAAAAAIAAAGLAGAAAAAAAAGAAVLVATAAGVFVIFVSPGIEETENHLLMMNSSKYLKNKLMLVELNNSGHKAGFQELKEENEEVRQWLLERIEDIVEDDFVEYNSRPYGHWSMTGLLNLRDFSCEVSLFPIVMVNPSVGSTPCDADDRALVTAVDALLDLHSAKAALGSLEALRNIPFRRLVSENHLYATGKSLMELDGGADHMIAAMQFWTGITDHGPNGRASQPSIDDMVWHATSGYRPAELILNVALDRSTPYEQTITHGGFERYVSGPGWLITAGGDATRPAQGFTWVVGATTYFVGVPDNDHGAGVPTTFMARHGPARDKYTDFLRFDGVHEDWPPDDGKPLISFSKNRCVTESFACGLRLQIPGGVESCLRTAPNAVGSGLRFIDSATCPEYRDPTPSPADDFYLAVFSASCGATSGCQGGNWGFLEVAPRSAFPSLDDYAKAVIAANASHMGSWAGGKGDEEINFVQVTQGNRTLAFTPEDEDFGADCRACGGVINHESGARFNIKHPRGGGRIFLDLNNEEKPVRRGEGGVSLCPATPTGQPPIGEYCFDNR